MRPITKNPPKSAKITANAAIKTVTARLVGGEKSFLAALDDAAALEEVGVGELMTDVSIFFLGGWRNVSELMIPQNSKDLSRLGTCLI